MTEVYEDYADRMRQVRPFQFFGITPLWHPGEKDVEGFCHDEVVRQFHDTGKWRDGGQRVEGMVQAWRYAEGRARLTPTIEDVKEIARLIEPDYNRDGFRHENVYVGNRMGVFPPYLWMTTSALVAVAGDVVLGGASTGYIDHFQLGIFEEQVKQISTVDQWYLAFEWIHPFRDGNGRTGKVLHNWLSGTLDDPVLIPDYFGGGNP